MKIFTFTERFTIIRNPDGTIKGGEARDLTGYLKEVDVPDAPAGKQLVFYAVEPEVVRAVTAADYVDVVPDHAAMLVDNAAKSSAITTLMTERDALAERVHQAETVAEQRAQTIAEQAAKIASDREDHEATVTAMKNERIGLREQIASDAEEHAAALKALTDVIEEQAALIEHARTEAAEASAAPQD